MDVPQGVFKSSQKLKNHQLKYLNRLLEITYKENEFYKTFYRRKRLIFPKKINSWEEYAKLPLVSRKDLQYDYEKHPPLGRNINLKQMAKVKIRRTSGTTGRSLYFVESEEDRKTKFKMLQRRYGHLGVDDKDVIYMFWPPDMYEFHAEVFMSLGATVYMTDLIPDIEIIKNINRQKINNIFLSPSHAVQLSHIVAKEKVSIDRKIKRRFFLNGEPGGFDWQFRKKIKEVWNAECVNIGGASELDQIFTECPQSPGYSHLAEEFLLCEIINPDTLKPDLVGELVVTALWKTGSSFIRYRTGDKVTMVGKKCRCGNVTTLIEGGLQGRMDQAINLNSALIYTNGVEAIIRRYFEIIDYRIEILNINERNFFRIYIETDKLNKRAQNKMLWELEAYVYHRPEIKIVAPGTFKSNIWKTKRIIDSRNNKIKSILLSTPFLKRWV